MVPAKEHYDQHLGPVYTWMLGDMTAALDDARAELFKLGIDDRAPGIAVDLGAGPGVYSIPLAELGFSVIALDSCAGLLKEIRDREGDYSIQTIEGDLTSFRTYYPGRTGVILCMGDTLTHLPAREAVQQLLKDVKTALNPDGLFVATFRDYMSAPLEGVARFIPVRSDESRILTCFLEYGDTVVTVYDILQDRNELGWSTKVSSYPKLRLEPAWVEAQLQRLGFQTILECGSRGMVRLIGRT